jgi:hypothetical protein
LTADVMFVNGIAFLVTLSRDIRLLLIFLGEMSIKASKDFSTCS